MYRCQGTSIDIKRDEIGSKRCRRHAYRLGCRGSSSGDRSVFRADCAAQDTSLLKPECIHVPFSRLYFIESKTHELQTSVPCRVPNVTIEDCLFRAFTTEPQASCPCSIPFSLVYRCDPQENYNMNFLTTKTSHCGWPKANFPS